MYIILDHNVFIHVRNVTLLFQCSCRLFIFSNVMADAQMCKFLKRKKIVCVVEGFDLIMKIRITELKKR